MNDPAESAAAQTDSALHQALRAELETTRQAFHALLATLTPEDWDRPSRNPSWTIGELLWHITLYLYLIPQQLIWLQTNTFPDPFAEAADELNEGDVQQTHEGAQEHSFAVIVQSYEAGHAPALAALASVRDHEWQIGVQMPDMGPTFGAVQHHLVRRALVLHPHE